MTASSFCSRSLTRVAAYLPALRTSLVAPVCAASMFLIAGCKTTPPLRPAAATVVAQPDSVAGLAAGIRTDSQRSERESDSRARGELASDAASKAEACLAREPQAAACLYGRAVAFGLEARAHPARAGELLNDMLANLTRAEAADPGYDEAGPARVRALVLLKAPGWPLGPGDADAGLVAARRAATLRPKYPPNQLALAEALAKTGDAYGAQRTYALAREAALAFPDSEERADWVREADRGLHRE